MGTKPNKGELMSQKKDMIRIRSILFSELKTLRKGNTDTKRAVAVSRLSAQIIASSRVNNETAALNHPSQ